MLDFGDNQVLFANKGAWVKNLKNLSIEDPIPYHTLFLRTSFSAKASVTCINIIKSFTSSECKVSFRENNMSRLSTFRFQALLFSE